MTRSLLLTIALAITCLAAAAGAFLAGRSNAPDLSMLARAGTFAGARSGARSGAAAATQAGYRAGYQVGYERAYPGAYKTGYLTAVGR
jgi:hypothetical protein